MHQAHIGYRVAGGAVGSYCFCCCAPDPRSLSERGAELYDPQTGTWSCTDSLNSARHSHTATLLANGQVLVTGGFALVNEPSPLMTAELYDPLTGVWGTTGSLNGIQGSNSTALLASGKVLAVGRYSDGSPYSAELYDPSTGTWSNTDSPPIGGGIASSILLPNGKVLAVAGSSAALFDPASDTWVSIGNSMRWFCSQTMTLLGNGKVLVIGLGNTFPGPLGGELYDSNTGMWSTTGSPRANRFWQSYRASLLHNDLVLLVGGYSSHSIPEGEEIYNPATGTWSYGDERPLPKTCSSTF